MYIYVHINTYTSQILCRIIQDRITISFLHSFIHSCSLLFFHYFVLSFISFHSFHSFHFIHFIHFVHFISFHFISFHFISFIHSLIHTWDILLKSFSISEAVHCVAVSTRSLSWVWACLKVCNEIAYCEEEKVVELIKHLKKVLIRLYPHRHT